MVNLFSEVDLFSDSYPLKIRKVTMRATFVLVGLMVLTLHVGSVHAVEIDFEKEIAPILEERCWHCHGEDEQESGLRLDLRGRMLRGGDSGLAAVVPGDAMGSYLIEVVKHIDPEMAMPPDEE